MTEKQVTLTVRDSKQGSVTELIDKFEKQLQRYQKHVYRTNRQCDYFSQKRNTMGNTNCVIHIDFSENYICGYYKEIQGMHFGASKNNN
ncbi:hypothetical protein DPMN_042841 [Dreissena polymorpha]|uniref:Uncharacterized protein n=1 Tax=Dreissena polymorpha TaxID=45954 RepID=A0A9D4D2S8_DREPO|nr:hypothetical protein DPMN_042841 [Dreissena polymorpha]